MLWIALHLPRLPLEAFAQASASTEPQAVVDGGRVLVCNAPARARGVRPGMSLATAGALAPALVQRAREPAAEAAALEQLAAWALQFTPSVSLEPPAGLVLEIEGSLKLLGGLKAILAALERGAADMGYTLSTGVAPTVAAAWLLARAGCDTVVSCKRMIAPAVAPLPLRALDCAPAVLETLAAAGVKTVGEALALPREGAARRCGPQFTAQLDRVLGVQPEARRFFAPAETFAAKLELGCAVDDAPALLLSARRLLVQLAGSLAARCGSIERFRLALIHEDLAPTLLEVGLATPTRDAQRFVEVLRERLAALTLAAPVTAIGLAADDILQLAGESRALFHDAAERGDEWERLLERLRARLGGEAVHGLATCAEHRPERAWQAAAPGTRGAAPAARTRPLWLLGQPRPLRQVAEKPHAEDGPLALIAGPERIESGWWDGGEVRRDYFVAQAANRATLWIYRERRRPGGWYLHGIFG